MKTIRLIALYDMESHSSPPGRAPRRPTRSIALGAADLEVLDFLAEHRLARVDHVQSLLGVSARTAERRVARLLAAGHARPHGLFVGQPAAVQITARGLSALASELPPPRLHFSTYRHDVGVAWLWLAARAGTFGPLREVVGERRMRSADRPDHRSEPPLAVRLGGLGSRGEERLHYPDLSLVTESGHRVAVELELSGKGRARREGILAAFGAAPDIDAVLYLVADRQIGAAIAESARRMGLEGRVMVQGVAIAEPTARPEPARVADRAHARAGSRGRPGGRGHSGTRDAEAER